MRTDANPQNTLKTEVATVTALAPASDASICKGEKLYERERFMAWLALPTWARNPKTQNELARELHVHVSTLVRWRHDETVLAEVRRMVRRELIGRYGSVLDALATKAEAGDVAAIRIFLEYVCGEGGAAKIEVEVNSMGATQINIAEAVRETEKVDALPGWLLEQTRAKAASGEELTDAERNIVEQFGMEG